MHLIGIFNENTISDLLQEALIAVLQWCDGSRVFQSTKDTDNTIHQEERCKGLEGTSPLWTHIAANYWGQIPWTYSKSGFDKEGTAEKCDKAYRALWTCKGTFGKTQGSAFDLHHGDHTHVDLQLHGLVAEGRIEC